LFQLISNNWQFNTYLLSAALSQKQKVLYIVVIAQFCCTSIWFAGNSVIEDLRASFELGSGAVASLTSAIQLGFILGTFVFALFSIADRYSPSKVFFFSAFMGSLFNLALILESNNLQTILCFRFLTGFSLAGIYPVGMKIAADYFKEGLGKSLGYLVGALVMGSALPHLISGLDWGWQWQGIIGTVFKEQSLRKAAFGYFGHMWELYTFWAFVPVILSSYQALHPDSSLNISLLSFLIIGIGGLACPLSGSLAVKFSAEKVASLALFLSSLCCLSFPLFFNQGSAILLLRCGCSGLSSFIHPGCSEHRAR